MSTQREALTQADIARYNDMLQQGQVDAFYRDLESKGYRSVAWAKKEFDKSTLFLEKQISQSA